MLVDDPRPRAFCAGYLQRRIYGSTGALSGCTIMVVSFPGFSALAAAPSLQRRRMA